MHTGFSNKFEIKSFSGNLKTTPMLKKFVKVKCDLSVTYEQTSTVFFSPFSFRDILNDFSV